CIGHAMGVIAPVTGRSFELLSKSLRERLPRVVGFPDTLAKRLREAKPQDDMLDQVEARVQLVADLREAALSGRDRMEPSLTALGHLVEEIGFKQLIPRLELAGLTWGVPTDDTIATYRPLCEHHPYGAYVDAFSRSQGDSDKAAETIL